MESTEKNKVNLIRKFFMPTYIKVIWFAILLPLGYFIIFLFFGFEGGVGTPLGFLIAFIFQHSTIFPLSLFLKFSPLLFIIFALTFVIYIITCFTVFIYEYINKIEKQWIRRLVKVILIISVILFFIFPLVIYEYDGSCWSPFRLCNGHTHQPGPYTIEPAWNKGCNILRNVYGCDADKISNVNTEVDINSDGIADNLLEVCRFKFNDSSATKYFCRNQCCGLSPSSPCETDKDCATPYYYMEKSNWVCDLKTHKCKRK